MSCLTAITSHTPCTQFISHLSTEFVSTTCLDYMLGLKQVILPKMQVAGYNMHTPLNQRSRSGMTMPLSGFSVGTYLEMSPHATHQGTLGHSRLSLLSHCELILA